MITCKEDLMNTYIENDFGELRRAYVDKAIELGYVHEWGTVRSYGWYDLPYIGINRNWSLDFIGQTSDVTRGIRDTKSKLLTLSDLKPTQTKFVKVEESIFDLRGEFERGELYFDVAAVSGGVFLSNDEYVKVNSKESLCECYSNGNVYRQVEIDWRDEVKEVYDAVELPVGEQGSLYMGEDWDEQEFIKFCHLVASLTEKPEGV